MSISENKDPLPAPSYGVREFDLTTTRGTGDELIRARNARALAVLQVDDECYARFGGTTAPRIDLREFERGSIERQADIEEPFGEIYIENPSGTTGSLKILLGGTIKGLPQSIVDVLSSLDSINGTGQIEDSTSSAGTNVKVNLGDLRQKVDIYWDGSGSSTLTVEVSDDDSTWRQLDTVSTDSTQNIEQFDVAYQYVRASVAANLNTLEIVSRGL